MKCKGYCPGFELGSSCPTTITIIPRHTHSHTHIFIHRQTVSFYHNSSVWLETHDVSSWDRTRLTLRQSEILSRAIVILYKELFTYIFLHICYRLLSSWEKLLRFNQCDSWQISHERGQHTREEHIYIYIYIYNNNFYNFDSVKKIKQMMQFMN